MKHSRVYGLVHIYAELVPLLVNDLDGSNDFPNREKGQFGQNGGVGLNEGIGETFSEGFEYAEDCEVSNATEGMDASVLRNVWNYLMLVHDEEILVNVRHLPLHPVVQSSLCSRAIHQMMMQMLVKRVKCQDMRLTTQHHLTQATMMVLTVKQKIQGLPSAVHKALPNVEHRHCARQETNRDSGATSSNKQRIIIPGPLKMKNADTGSTVHQASTAAKLNQPAQGSTMHKASQNASCN
ncbi:hypothetical protein NC652_021271 [Populus alba x Populus x berolinensis]|nr:hypothetical protein NC652_021267 [Populus alba x Populus x berolinensis]KAJ6910553.1 hypothetical protein NC652_021271 [Populus alba x Populus x berolinensis]